MPVKGDIIESKKTPGVYAMFDGRGWVPQPQGWAPQAGPHPVKLSDQEDKQMAALRDQAAKSSYTDQQTQRFMQLNHQAPTGPIYGGGAFNPVNWFWPKGENLQAMESITSGLAPAQRIPGSGSSSDKDVEMFRAGLPSIDKWGTSNARIADNLHNVSVQDRARVSFYDQWTQAHGTLNGAAEAFQQKLDEIATAPDQQTASRLVAALVGSSPAPAQPRSPAAPPRKAATPPTTANDGWSVTRVQ
jgi:hypothetical protein